MRPPAVEQALRSVDRRRFLPEEERRRAGQDRPLPIGLGQTNSQPTTVANMLELLDVQPGQRVLDVGAGSGWTTALLGRLVGPDGEVIGVELEPDLARWGADNLATEGLPWAELRAARPDVLGWPEDAPYDRVLLSADAPGLPIPLLDQLAEDGVFVGPVRGRMLRVRRHPGGDPLLEDHGRYAFVPLR